MEYVPAKTIVTRYNKKNSNKWFGYEYNMNIYRGCNHGCVYCDSRCSCYQVENFDLVRAKEDALRIIRDDLRRKAKTGVIGTGAMSDPYNSFEKELQLTRHALALVDAFGFGIGLSTKSDMITRDIDILQEIQSHSAVLAKLTITTCDDSLSKKLEPGAPVSSKRFQALKELSAAGLFTGILMMPILPLIEDQEENIIGIVELAAEAGVRFIYPSMGVTLRGNQKQWFFAQTKQWWPDLEQKYQTMYGDYIYCFSKRYKALMKKFEQACDRYGIIYRMDHIIRKARDPYKYSQLSLF